MELGRKVDDTNIRMVLPFIGQCQEGHQVHSAPRKHYSFDAGVPAIVGFTHSQVKAQMG